ncbi:prostaglandin reductase 1 isoform X1 [Hyalella azteca]|uniref:Prostaglandin reductase 1 n=2 Tax=Hyalella azteca TaxID=294128 RepID=A0A8B7PPM2_HYAAZ|nr:prostaglandin reductase 1 isoform X1 [Hyalella azteca]
MVLAKTWILDKVPDGVPSEDNFKLVNEELPTPNDGEFIVEAEWLSVDPYMRYMIRDMKIGAIVTGSQVARVIESKNAEYPVGTRLVGQLGWRSHTLLPLKKADGTTADDLFSNFAPLLPEIEGLPHSTALGVLGMPGNTAYFGFLEICKPRPGDVVVVNAAAGVVGSAVCQIAKMKGCKVIAFAGSADKVSWLRELGADVAANYKTDDVAQVIRDAAPNGVNCYFDNVGGEFSSKVIPLMASMGRVSLCGAISTYNDHTRHIGVSTMCSPLSEGTIIWKQLRVEGFIVTRWLPRWREGIKQMRDWIDEGKLKYRETVTEGFENQPKAFIGLFTGDNIGKAVVKV